MRLKSSYFIVRMVFDFGFGWTLGLTLALMFALALLAPDQAQGQSSIAQINSQAAPTQAAVSQRALGTDGLGPSPAKVPSGVILVKGAWSSASDSVTPLPEEAGVSDRVFHDAYFGIRYTLPTDWTEGYKGPPPSDTGRYVLAEFIPADTFKGPAGGNVLITAQDMFFTPRPAADAAALIKISKDSLRPDYKVEVRPTPTRVAGRPFTYFAYWSPVAELHWYVLATDIRCHTVEIVLSSRDTKLLASLMADLDKMKFADEVAEPSAGAGSRLLAEPNPGPVCIKDYAAENLIQRVDPAPTGHRFNPLPVRIIIDKDGRVKHVHFISAFPDQAKSIADALAQWQFRPYRQKGQPVEVETGILFGLAPHSPNVITSRAQ